MRKAIIFDRDGTLIIDRVYLNDPDDIEYLPGAFEALRKLRDHGYVFTVATNQSGIPRGLVDIRNLHLIHDKIRGEFASFGIDILSFHYAPYMTDFNHPYRKPNPGMLLESARWHRLDLSRSWMVGDRMTDIEAGQRVGMRTALITHNNVSNEAMPPDVIRGDLLSLADAILAHDVAQGNRTGP